MKNSNINCIQKQLQNGFKTIVSFGKRIEVALTSSQIERLQNQLRIARLLEPKQLWTSNRLEPLIHPTLGVVIGYKTVVVQGTYSYLLNGELKEVN